MSSALSRLSSVSITPSSSPTCPSLIPRPEREDPRIGHWRTRARPPLSSADDRPLLFPLLLCFYAMARGRDPLRLSWSAVCLRVLEYRAPVAFSRPRVPLVIRTCWGRGYGYHVVGFRRNLTTKRHVVPFIFLTLRRCTLPSSFCRVTDVRMPPCTVELLFAWIPSRPCGGVLVPW